jgi:hypothetical protein
MKNIVRLTETELKRIVNRVISEDEQMADVVGEKTCTSVGVKTGKFLGEKDGNAYLMYYIGYPNNEILKPGEYKGGSPRRCTFKRTQEITLV